MFSCNGLDNMIHLFYLLTFCLVVCLFVCLFVLYILTFFGSVLLRTRLWVSSKSLVDPALDYVKNIPFEPENYDDFLPTLCYWSVITRFFEVF